MASDSEEGQHITPFDVVITSDQIDYDAVVNKFGSTKITSDLISRFERLTNTKAHPFLRRGLYFSHRDFDKILDLYEKKEPFYLFTGRGPSSGAMHIGHMVPFLFTAYMQKTFNCPLVIQVNDDEKFFWKDVKLNELSALSDENIKEVLAFDFIREKTFIFKNSEYIGEMYPTICEIQKRVTFNQVKAIFGVTTSCNIGKIAFPAIQAAPSFSTAFKKLFGGDKIMNCLILCAIDQDPYFRMTRDVAPRMKLPKPALLHCKFIPGLQGVNSKMSASQSDSAVLLTDTKKILTRKINRAVSGGRETVEQHRKEGADLAKDVGLAYLRFFLDDDEELARIEREYGEGRMLTGEVKKILVDTIYGVLRGLQERRERVSEEDVRAFKAIRDIN